MAKGSVERSHVFLTLDALRGAAALAVMEFHTSRFFGLQIFPHGYLAVDFFFMLSGFVLTFAYQEKLDRGWLTRAFLKMRLIRLYPLYALGLLLGTVFTFFESRYGHLHLSSEELLVLFALGILLVPAPPSYAAAGPAMFPLNVPSWSLFYEVVANLFHVALLRRRGFKALVCTLTVCGISFAMFAWRLGTMNFGVYRSETFYGIARVMFSYMAGMMLCRIWRNARAQIRVPGVLPIPALLTVLLIPEWPRHRVIPELFVVFCVFPVLILAGASARLPSWLVRPGQILGTASYAIYVLHIPIAESFEQVWVRVRGHRIEADAPWPGLVLILLMIAVSMFVDAVYDVPVRRFLRKILNSKPAEGGEPSTDTILQS